MLLFISPVLLLLLTQPTLTQNIIPVYQNSTLAEMIPPKVNWLNMDIDNPSFIISFSCGFQIQASSTLQNFYLKVDLPFLATALTTVQWSQHTSTTTPCCDYSTLAFSTATSSLISAYDGSYTSFYVQLAGASYVQYRPFILRFTPDKYMTKVGYSESMKLSLLATNHADSVIYCYNNSFMPFYAEAKPSDV